MKRSKHINLDRMRKRPLRSSALPVAAAVTVSLQGCSSGEPAHVMQSITECKLKFPEQASECEYAYENAVARSDAYGPSYHREQDCEEEFGYGQCDRQGGFFTPFMAGYLLSSARGFRNSAPVYTSKSFYSPFRDKWVNGKGQILGNANQSVVKVGPDAFDMDGRNRKTLRRGGFGSKVRALSSGSGYSRGGSWGGWGG